MFTHYSDILHYTVCVSCNRLFCKKYFINPIFENVPFFLTLMLIKIVLHIFNFQTTVKIQKVCDEYLQFKYIYKIHITILKKI